MKLRNLVSLNLISDSILEPMAVRYSFFPAFASSAVLLCTGVLPACGGSSDDDFDPAPPRNVPAPNGTAIPGSNAPSGSPANANGKGYGASKPPVGRATKPDEMREFEFSYEGVPGPIKGKVSSAGEISFDSWPTNLSPIVHLEVRPLEALDDAFCSRVERTAKFGALNLVRGMHGYTLAIDALPTGSFGFRIAAAAGARPLGLGAMLSNSTVPKLLSAKARVILADGAISSILGNMAELDASLAKLSVSSVSAQMNGEIFAQDLMCDLRSGKASIEFDVTTDKPGYRPLVKTAGFKGPS